MLLLAEEKKSGFMCPGPEAQTGGGGLVVAIHCHGGSDDCESLHITHESWGGVGGATAKKADQTHVPPALCACSQS